MSNLPKSLTFFEFTSMDFYIQAPEEWEFEKYEVSIQRDKPTNICRVMQAPKEAEKVAREMVRRYNEFMQRERKIVELKGRLKEERQQKEHMDEALQLIRNRLEDQDSYDTISYLEIIDAARGVGEFA